MITPDTLLEALDQTALDRMVTELPDDEEWDVPVFVVAAIRQVIAAELNLAMAALRWKREQIQRQLAAELRHAMDDLADSDD